MCSLWLTGLGRESHSPEIVQWLKRFNAGFPQFAVALMLYPGDAKLGGLLRKTVGDFDVRSDLQPRGTPDPRPQTANPPGIRGFLKRSSVGRRTTQFHGNPHHNPRTLPF